MTITEMIKRFSRPLQAISIDKDHNETMTDSQLAAVDYDSLIREYAKGRNFRTPKSNDALVLRGDAGWFIEFKNGSLSSRREINALHSKNFESLLMLMDICGPAITLEDIRSRFTYILVYNPARNPGFRHKIQGSAARDRIKRRLIALGGDEFRVGGLHEVFERVYFKAVHTWTKEEFEQKFIRPMEAAEKERDR